jgi:hypothetical protein
VRVLAWLGAFSASPRPDVRILELGPTGDGAFSALIQNQGSRPCRCGIAATVRDRPVDCLPAIVDLLPNGPPTRVRIHVAAPQLGAELTIQVNDGKRLTKATWTERA